jgi:hypothetical protein
VARQASTTQSASPSVSAASDADFVIGARKAAPSKPWKAPAPPVSVPRLAPMTSSGQRLSCATRTPVAVLATAGPAETMTAERRPPAT